jgi:hypothetical protein
MPSRAAFTIYSRKGGIIFPSITIAPCSLWRKNPVENPGAAESHHSWFDFRMQTDREILHLDKKTKGGCG